MPLINGYSKSSFEKNLKTLLKEGYSRKQALAIAYSICRKAYNKHARSSKS